VEKILEGDLSRFELPDLLTFLNMGKRTGVLVLESTEHETKIFFTEGRPIFATSTKEELRIGAMLVRLGRVKEADIDRVLAAQRAPGARIGEALLAERLLTREELASFLKVQVSEIIFDTFSWRAGSFTLYDKIPPPSTAVTLVMDLQNLIMEAVRRIDERGRLSEVFPDLDMVAEAVANPERVKQSVTLTREEWQVLFLVDGRRSLAEICRLAGSADDLGTLQIIHNLVAANLVIIVPALAPTGPGSELPPVAEFTQKVDTSKPPTTQPKPPAVEFTAGVPKSRAIEDDTHEIVSHDAVRYLGQARTMTVSRLLLAEQGRPETSFPLSKDSATLGRHKNNDIVISDPKVSSFHARIDRVENGHVLVDLKSRNGSYVNAKRVENQPLKNGDEVRVGTARLTYKVDYIAQS
jgi:hypothetical protein